MGTRTHVSMVVRNDHLDEGRQALWNLVTGPFGPVELYRSNAPDATTTLYISFDGDVSGQVKDQLDALTRLEYQIEVRDD